LLKCLFYLFICTSHLLFHILDVFYKFKVFITVFVHIGFDFFCFTFSSFGAERPIGASTGMAYLSTILFGLDAQQYQYTQEIEQSGVWSATGWWL